LYHTVQTNCAETVKKDLGSFLCNYLIGYQQGSQQVIGHTREQNKTPINVATTAFIK